MPYAGRFITVLVPRGVSKPKPLPEGHLRQYEGLRPTRRRNGTENPKSSKAQAESDRIIRIWKGFCYVASPVWLGGALSAPAHERVLEHVDVDAIEPILAQKAGRNLESLSGSSSLCDRVQRAELGLDYIVAHNAAHDRVPVNAGVTDRLYLRDRHATPSPVRVE